jgi:metal-sulfur cluster biosynthetic enzyme
MCSLLTESAVRSALAHVYDPEFGLSIESLGLIYEISIAEDRVAVAMTLTSMHCPAGQIIVEGVRAAVSVLPGVRDVQVELVWTPPWTPDRLSPEARKQLGWENP